MKPTNYIRWRFNAGGVQWFWNDHWYSVKGTLQTSNLFVAIEKITSTYPKERL